MKDVNGEACLEIGEWDALEKCEMRGVEVAWGDGTTDSFAFSNDYTYNEEYSEDREHNWGYTFIRRAYLNGVQYGEDTEYRWFIYNLIK